MKINIMFLQLNHQRLEVFKTSKAFEIECYKITKQFPADEKFAMVQQIKRAALSVHLNIAEGCSRKSVTERNRYFEIPGGSLIEIDSALDVAYELQYCSKVSGTQPGQYLIDCFKMLSSLLQKPTER